MSEVELISCLCTRCGCIGEGTLIPGIPSTMSWEPPPDPDCECSCHTVWRFIHLKKRMAA